jgi:Outer membrane protein beta-barrel domain
MQMKKYLLIFCFMVFGTLQAQAQIEAGKILLGGSVSYSGTDTESGKSSTSNFSILPAATYMVSKQIGLGLGIGYSTGSSETKQSNFTQTLSTSSSSFSLNPHARYYKAIGGSENFYFFGQMQVFLGFSDSKTTQSNFSSSQSSTTMGIDLSPNFAFMPGKKWAIELGLNGIGYSIANPEGDNNNQSNFSFGISSFVPRIGPRLVL